MFRMPAEWEAQKTVWLAWPDNKNDWPGKFEMIPWVYTDIIRHISRTQQVCLVVKNSRAQEQATSMLTQASADLSNVTMLKLRTDRSWLRDSAPTLVYDDGEPTLLDWQFNGWAKYDNFRKDAKVPAFVAKYRGYPLVEPVVTINGRQHRVVLEGGAIDVNGEGSLLTTEECLLSDVQCRNKALSRDGYEQLFHEYLGVTNVIWLGQGIMGDDTHGHIDDLARFVRVDTVVVVVEKDRQDANYAPLQENLRRLRAAKDQDGNLLTVVELPMPRPVVFDGQRLPASYANFLITNKLVLVPTFNDPNDRMALAILAGLFPDREVIGIYCGDLVWGLGTIHCASNVL